MLLRERYDTWKTEFRLLATDHARLTVEGFVTVLRTRYTPQFNNSSVSSKMLPVFDGITSTKNDLLTNLLETSQ